MSNNQPQANQPAKPFDAEAAKKAEAAKNSNPSTTKPSDAPKSGKM